MDKNKQKQTIIFISTMLCATILIVSLNYNLFPQVNEEIFEHNNEGTPSITTFDLDGKTRYAQIFSPTVKHSITRIRLMFSFAPWQSFWDDFREVGFVVSLHKATATNPYGDIITVKKLTSNDINNEQWTDIIFPMVVDVFPNEYYSIIITPVKPDLNIPWATLPISFPIGIGVSPGTYSEGQWWLSTDGSTWIPQPGMDLFFETWGEFKQGTFTVTIYTSPKNCTVRIDDELEKQAVDGIAVFGGIDQGFHNIRVSKDFYQTSNRTVNIDADSYLNFNLKYVGRQPESPAPTQPITEPEQKEFPYIPLILIAIAVVIIVELWRFIGRKK